MPDFWDPTPGQQDEAALGLGQLDDFQLDPMFFGLLSRCISGIALVNESEFDRLTSDLLDRLRQFAHLRSILLIGGRHQQSQQVAQGIDRRMHFAAFAPLGAILPTGCATSFISAVGMPCFCERGMVCDSQQILPLPGIIKIHRVL